MNLLNVSQKYRLVFLIKKISFYFFTHDMRLNPIYPLDEQGLLVEVIGFLENRFCWSRFRKMINDLLQIPPILGGYNIYFYF